MNNVSSREEERGRIIFEEIKAPKLSKFYKDKKLHNPKLDKLKDF